MPARLYELLADVRREEWDMGCGPAISLLALFASRLAPEAVWWVGLLACSLCTLKHMQVSSAPNASQAPRLAYPTQTRDVEHATFQAYLRISAEMSSAT